MSNKTIGMPGLDAMPWAEDFKKLVDKFQLPGLDLKALMDWQRKDMEALAEANRQAYEGTKTLMERRTEILRDAFSEWQDAMKEATNPAAFGPDAVARQTEAAKQGVEAAMANFRELAQLEMQTRTNAWKVVQDRIQENLGNLQKLLQPK